jgi:hypothetical protein
MSYGLQTDANDLIQSHFTVFIRRTFVSCLMSCDILDAFVHREKMVCQMAEMGQSRLRGASCRSSHVRNAPLATVGPKKAACRDGPL